MEPDENVEVFKRETEIANSILRINRYSTVPPYKWYGPDPEPAKIFTREDLKHMLGNSIFDWQWDVVKLYMKDHPKPPINVSEK